MKIDPTKPQTTPLGIVELLETNPTVQSSAKLPGGQAIGKAGACTNSSLAYPAGLPHGSIGGDHGGVNCYWSNIDPYTGKTIAWQGGPNFVNA